MRYAFIGLGNLGQCLAALLTRRFEVLVNDKVMARAGNLMAAGAKWMPDAPSAVKGVDAVFTCLPSPQASRSLMVDPGGCLEHMPRGSAWFELSTVGPQEIREFADAGVRAGVSVIDSPVTGGIHRASRGEMTMLVGGPTDAVDRHRAALEAMCSPVIHLGPIGSAATAKLITNMLCMIDLIAAGDALLLARRSGLDLNEFYRAVVASSGNSREFEDWVPRILDGSFDTGFTLALALKDLNLVSDLSRELRVSLRLSEQVQSLLAEARTRCQDGDKAHPVLNHLATLKTRSSACSINQALACSIDAGASLHRAPAGEKRVFHQPVMEMTRGLRMWLG